MTFVSFFSSESAKTNGHGTDKRQLQQKSYEVGCNKETYHLEWDTLSSLFLCVCDFCLIFRFSHYISHIISLYLTLLHSSHTYAHTNTHTRAHTTSYSFQNFMPIIVKHLCFTDSFVSHMFYLSISYFLTHVYVISWHIISLKMYFSTCRCLNMLKHIWLHMFLFYCNWFSIQIFVWDLAYSYGVYPIASTGGVRLWIMM